MAKWLKNVHQMDCHEDLGRGTQIDESHLCWWSVSISLVPTASWSFLLALKYVNIHKMAHNCCVDIHVLISWLHVTMVPGVVKLKKTISSFTKFRSGTLVWQRNSLSCLLNISSKVIPSTIKSNIKKKLLQSSDWHSSTAEGATIESNKL